MSHLHGHESRPGSQARPATQPATQLEHPRALVVDDEPAVVVYVRGLLEELGYKVDTASGVREAMEVLNGHDLVVHDWEMEDGTGTEISRAVRGRGGSARVIVMTGRSENDADIAASHPDAQLRKPFGSDELRDAIKSVLH